MKKAKASVKQQNTREQDETDFDFNSTDWKEFSWNNTPYGGWYHIVELY